MSSRSCPAPSHPQMAQAQLQLSFGKQGSHTSPGDEILTFFLYAEQHKLLICVGLLTKHPSGEEKEHHNQVSAFRNALNN